MRHLKRGFTLIELLIAVAIGALLLTLGVPFFGDYIANARLREGGGAVHAEAQHAQSEAIRRNVTVRLTVSGSTMQLLDMSTGGEGTLIRSTQLPDPVQFTAAANLDFGSDGRPTPFGTAYAVDLVAAGDTCSAERRCPGLRVDAGGGVRLCADRLSGCP
jgi:type IV fimbrial biogenesis protein FimT